MGLKVFPGNVFAQTYGSGPMSVLCLHGWARDHNDFEKLFSPTEDKFSALVPDMAGFGSTPAPEQVWGTDQYSCALDPLVDSMQGPIIILGHSFGGRVALDIATRRPDDVKALILTGVPLLPSTGTKKAKPSIVYKSVRKLNSIGLIPESVMQKMREKYGSKDYLAASGIMRQILVKTVNENYEQKMRQLRCPVELVWGQKDGAVPIDVAYRAQKIIPDAKVTICEGIGHMTPLYASSQLYQTILKYI